MKIKFEFKIRDMWIGIYWTYGTIVLVYERKSYVQYDIWLCLVPCFPIHLIINGKVK